MITLPVYDRAGSEVGQYELEPAEIAPRISKQLLHDAVVMYQANLRLGTHKTKSRGQVRGSTRKLYRQKGTGNARAGSRRSGVRVGGGHIHALKPRDYSYRLPRKALRLATRMAIAAKIRDQEVVVLDRLQLDRPATRDMAQLLRNLGLDGTTTLVATETHDANVYLSARNIQGVTVLPLADLNALAVLKPRRFLVTTGALDRLRAGAANAGPDKGSLAGMGESAESSTPGPQRDANFGAGRGSPDPARTDQSAESSTPAPQRDANP